MSFINVMGKIAADNIRVERTAKITLAEDGLYYIFKLPKKAFIHAVHLEILTATDDPGGTNDPGTLTVGFVGNAETAVADYFMATNVALPLVAGMKTVTKGKWFVDAGGAITLTWDSQDSTTAPVIRAYVAFTVLH